MNIKQERELIQQLLEEGQLDSLSVQVIALNRFASSIGYAAVNGDIRKGFSKYPRPAFSVTRQDFCSLEEMQSCYNRGFRTLRTSAHKVVGDKIVERISLQYNKKLGKLTSELHWIKFIKED
ncbi:MAG: DUF7390 domain-containing protein [Bacteroidales bacterium]